MPPSQRYRENSIQSILRLKNNAPAVGPLRLARSADATVIEAISLRIANDQLSTKQLLLTTGFGLDKNLKVPVRLPVLAIPGLQLMERMHEAGLPVPSYLLYQATGFIAETNNIDQQSAQECATLMQEYLQRYVATFHPNIAEHVRMEFGCDYPTAVQQDIEHIIDNIRLRITQNADVSQAMELLQTSGQKHSNGASKHGTYAAANVLYNGASRTYPFADDIPADLHAILPIGGSAEKPFFTLTSDFADRRGGVKVIPMLTMLGSKPTYYHYPESGDPNTADEFHQASRNARLNGPIRGDLAALISDAGSADAVADIFPQHS